MLKIRFFVVLAALSAGSLVLAAECPKAVRAAVEKAHPGAKSLACEEEREEGRLQYEVKVEEKHGKKLELDVSPEGKILLTEESVALDKVPAAVLKTLKTRHADARAREAERQTGADGKVTYEIAFEAGGEQKEATFTADGKLVEEEDKDEGEDED